MGKKNEMNYFCTLFDSFYLSRGLALYNSLLKNCENFELYILTFDEKAFEILKKLELKNVIVIPLKELETKELLKVKEVRNRAEYCWTFTPQIIEYVIKKYKVDMCTYLDADIYFLNSPDLLIDEIRSHKKRDVLITSHNYHKEHDQTHVSGEYCVQFVTFKNNENGRQVLKWWKENCLKWCYARLEDGKYGDQKYLEKFREKFKNIFVTEELGAGLAPWNTKRFIHSNGEIKEEDKVYKAIFYHYQALKISKDYNVMASSTDLGKRTIESYYIEYLEEIKKINKELTEKFNFISGLIEKITFRLKVEMILRNIKYDVIWASRVYGFNCLQKMSFILKRLFNLMKVYNENNFKI